MSLLTSILISGTIILFSSFIRGTAGFGLALIAVPLLSLIQPMREVIVLVAIVNLLFSIIHIFRERATVSMRNTVITGICSLAGVFIGFMLLRNINEQVIRIFTGSIIILSGLALLRWVRLKISNQSVAYSIATFAGGILAGSITIGGPVVALILTGTGIPRDKFRSSMSLFFLFSFSFAVLLYWSDNMINADTIVHTAAAIPFLVTGLLLGESMAKHINQRAFRVIVLTLLLVMGSVMIYKSIWDNRAITSTIQTIPHLIPAAEQTTAIHQDHPPLSDLFPV